MLMDIGIAKNFFALDVRMKLMLSMPFKSIGLNHQPAVIQELTN